MHLRLAGESCTVLVVNLRLANASTVGRVRNRAGESPTERQGNPLHSTAALKGSASAT